MRDYIYFGHLVPGQEFIDPTQIDPLVFVKDDYAGRAHQKDTPLWVVFFNDGDLVTLAE